MDSYNSSRDLTETFLRTVEEWIVASGEVFVVLRYLHAGGAKDYALCHSWLDFQEVVDVVAPGTDIVVFRQKQLPMRGAVTPEFIDNVLTTIPDGREFLIVRTTRNRPSNPRLDGEMGDSHVELTEALQSSLGDLVAAGSCPPFVQDDNQEMISASKGGIDGPR